MRRSSERGAPAAETAQPIPMDRDGHLGEARRWLARSEGIYNNSIDGKSIAGAQGVASIASVAAQIAQVHATLALADGEPS